MKKQILKLVSVLLICIIALGNVSVYASKNTDYLKGMGIVPGNFGATNENEPITRGEYAYIMAGLMTTEELSPVDTKFSDVTKSDYFSGQVQYLAQMGIAGGYGDGTFGDSDPLTLETAYVFLIRVLEFTGYVTFHDELQGTYKDLAYRIGLKAGNYTNADGFVTKGGAAELAYDALTTEIRGVHYKVTNGVAEILDDVNQKSNIMSHLLGISVYKGVVSEIDIPNNRLTFTVTKNVYSKNPVILSEGTEKEFQAEKNISVYEYNNLPVTICVNKEGELVNIVLDDNVEVKYTMVYSVNRDTSENAYDVSTIEEVVLYDIEKEYTVRDDATFTVNNRNFTGRFAFAGKFSKVVMVNDEIINLESWDLTEAGLVTSVSDTQIKYQKGSQSQVIRNLDTYETQIYIINGEIKSKDELSLNSVMYYYADSASGYIVIVASNGVLTATLEGVNSAGIVMGNIIVGFNNTFYYERLNGEFTQFTGNTSDLADLFGRRVSAYLAPDGRLLYLTYALGATVPNEFYGAVCGIKQESIFGEENSELLIWVLEGDVTKEIFKVTDKTVYEGGLNLDYIASKSSNLSGEGVFKFKAKANGEISKISPLGNVYGFTTTIEKNYTTNSPSEKFQSYSNKTYFYDNVNGPIYFDYQDVYLLYDIDGQFFADSVNYRDLINKVAYGTTLKAYGEGTSSQPTLVLMTGDVERIGETPVKGVVTDRSLILDKNDEEKYKLKVQTAKGVQEIIVAKADGELTPVDSFITYTPNTRFSNHDVFIDTTSIWDISGSVDSWFGADPSVLTAQNLTKGTVKEIDENRIVFDDGTLKYFKPGTNDVLCVDLSGAKRYYSASSIEEIVVGDTFITYGTSDGVTFTLVVKQ